MKSFNFKNQLSTKLVAGALALTSFMPSAQAIVTNEPNPSAPTQKITTKTADWIKKNPKKFGAMVLAAASGIGIASYKKWRSVHGPHDLTEVYYAIKRHDIKWVKSYFRKGIDINVQSCNGYYYAGEFELGTGYTPLMAAAHEGDCNIINYLLDNGASVDMRDSKNKTALMYAVKNGKVDAVRILLQRGADKDAHGEYDKTALMHAVEHGRVEIVRLLLQEGVDVNAYGHDYQNRYRTVFDIANNLRIENAAQIREMLRNYQAQQQ